MKYTFRDDIATAKTYAGEALHFGNIIDVPFHMEAWTK